MKKLLLLLTAIVSFAFNGFSQNTNWRKIDSPNISEDSKLARGTQVKEFAIYKLDLNKIKLQLAASPKRTATAESDVIIAFPNSEGEVQNFKMYESSSLEPEIAAKHPEIQSYVGKCIEDPTATISISTTIFGFHAITQSGKLGTDYIDPYTKDFSTYMVYNRSKRETSKTFSCETIDERDIKDQIDENQTLARANNSLWKVYRLALACTKQYGSFHVAAAGLTTASTLALRKGAVLNAMAVTVARLNSVYERDHAMKLVLINANINLINVNLTAAEIAAGVPNPNLDDANVAPAYTLLNGNQAYVDGIVGFNSYDIGHISSTGGGGVARSGVCTSIKAEGVTGSFSPVGDSYDIDFVAHEMGHQLSGSHTFNSQAGNCAGSTRVSSSAYEVGSGSTIMAYAGICGADDIQSNSDAYFHARSMIQINSQINGLASPETNCVPGIANNNTPPVVYSKPNLTNGNSVVPIGIPFKLTGSATDVDNPSGNALTYCWEQYGLGSAAGALVSTNTTGPSFRSFSPTTSPTRYFPKLSSILAGNTQGTPSSWEMSPSVARTITFSLIVRDNGGPLGGQTQRVTKTVQFVDTSAFGTFKITSPVSTNNPATWAQNSNQNVTWDVAGTNANLVNALNVNIRLSTDGGLTYPTFLATNTPNDGSESILAPNLYTQTARLMIEAVESDFFVISPSNFYIGYSVVNNCTNYTGNTTADNVFPFALADGVTSFTQKKFVLPAIPNVTDVNLSLNITHPNLQNLKIDIVRPGLILFSVYNQQCPGNANMNIKFDSQAAAFACTNPTTGTYALPSGSLNTINGNVAAGQWIVAFRDIVTGDAGTVNSIDLEVCSLTITQLPPVVVANENFTFQNLTIAPNPSNGNFNVKFDSGTNNKINIAVNDIRGRIVYENNYQNTGFFSENLELNNIQKGIYLVTIKDGEKQIVKKIIVE